MVDADDIIKSLNKGEVVAYYDKIISGDLDFTKLKDFSADGNALVSHYVSPEVTFVKCVFMGNVTASSKKDGATHSAVFQRKLSFRSCDFRAGFNFNRVIVGGDLILAQSVFRGHSSANFMTINGALQAWEIETEDDFMMNNALVYGNVSFLDGHSHKFFSIQAMRCENLHLGNFVADDAFDASMSAPRGFFNANYTSFSKQAQLNDLKIYGNFSAANAKFDAGINLHNSVFYGGFHIGGTTFASESDVAGVIFVLPGQSMAELLSAISVSDSKKSENNTEQ